MLSSWRAISSEGARLTISSGEGKTGKGMVMEFDLSNVYGYTIAQKDFSIDLPSNYQFTFDMKADIPVNNFEFKLLDADGNVYWIKKLNVEYPKQWEKQRIKKRHITFAWGPAGGGEIRKVAKIEFVVSSGLGGKGKVFIDNFRLEPIDDNLAKTARADFDASSMAKSGEPLLNEKGTLIQNWKGSNAQEWLSINFNHLKEIGGLTIDWDSTNHATAYDVQLSDDGKEWATAYTVTNGNGGRDYVYLPEKDARVLRVNMKQSAIGKGFGISRLEVKGPEFSQSPNDFFSTLAREAPQGYYPKYFLGKQCFWTVVGTSGDTKEALINELGTIEVDQQRFSLEPFLFVDGKLITWNDVERKQTLLGDYLPIPSVTWKYGSLTLTIRAFAPGTAGNSQLIVTYKIENEGSANPKGRLFVALRPFQVNPPWQWLNKVGGASRIDSIRNVNGLLYVQDKVVIPISGPDGFGATSFDSGDILEYLKEGKLPATQRSIDSRGFASAALQYDYDCPGGVSREFHVVVPFHNYSGSPTPGMRDGADIYTSLALAATSQFWISKLDRFQIKLPAFSQPIINTIKSQLAYIFINRDGAGIQPGSRSYERSWIRDGSLTSTALLELGITDEVKEYIDWYATYQFPGGKIPCVVDQRGGDPTNEHDSHGQFIYAVMQYFNFTKDTAWLRSKFETVVKTVRYIQSLRAERKTDLYKNGTPEQRACYGLVPESISHEGYSAQAMHSYWDDFFVLRGLKDATSIAAILGEKQHAAEFASERDDFRTDLYASMRLAMKTKKINFIPGCVELGDFDATSTTIGIHPANELGNIPELQLHNTFDRYYAYFLKRREGKTEWKDYTPYENRVIGSFVYLDQKERAYAAMEFFMKDRTPAAWNQWGEVVHRDKSTPRFIGDLPHTWCGSDFIRSIRAMFVYERESDTALVIGAGIADAWVKDSAGIVVTGLPTYYGNISYSIKKVETKKVGTQVQVQIERMTQMPSGSVVLKSPLSAKVKSVRVNGRAARVVNKNEIRIPSLPASIVLTY
ncbi:MAG: discoidin domain-containing protein [Ignavibacteriae bacterium]|nr:discoidin domain-containing protein [Ignavibacteriota bacterium]